MATPPVVTFQFPAGGYALAPYVDRNFGDLIKYISDRNAGTVDWDSISVAGSATFKSAITITPTSNQIVLGTTRTVTFTAPTPATTSRVITFPDLSGDYSVVGTIGTQSIGGAKTFTTSPLILSASAADLYFQAENTNNGSGTANSYVWIRNGGSSGGDPYLFLNVAGVTSYSIGLDNSDSDALCICENQGMSGTNLARITTATGVQHKGTTTNDSATAGFVGEEVVSVVSTSANMAATNTFGNITSISLTAGNWRIFGTVGFEIATGTLGTGAALGAISVNSGNTTSDHANGDNQVATALPSAVTDTTAAIEYTLKLSGTTTVYLKSRIGYSGGQPKSYGKIRAIRIR